MITTSGYGVAPSLLAYTLSSPSGLTGLSGGCNGSGRLCKPSCKPGMGGRRVSTALKTGCGCSALSGLRGLGAVQCYDDGSCYDAATGEWSYPDETTAWNATSGTGTKATVNTTIDYTKYFRDILLPKTTYPTGNVPAQQQKTGTPAATDEVPWPLIALLGAGLLLAVAS